VRRVITAQTVLISVMHANNEVGTLQPIAEIAAVARECGVAMHTDAAQSAGKVAVHLDQLGVDLISVAGHKMYAPQGVGALIVRRGIHLEPVLRGAGHEDGRRPGTENVASIVALGAACEIAGSWVSSQSTRTLRDHFWSRLQAEFGDAVILHGHPVHRLPNTFNVSFVGCSGHDILSRTPGMASSTGSACHAGSQHPSPVLQAMNVSPPVARGAIRFSLGRSTTLDEVEEAVRLLLIAAGPR
jgi:cysteine desulfurase